MIEEEALTKWCPMSNDGESGNRYQDGELFPSNSCISSDCMMWRATDNECEPQQHPKDSSAVMPEPKCYPAGYCGLAGK